jgi:clan AA aspartic protease (TIGR02281 family)
MKPSLTRSFFIALAVLIALPLYLMIGGGLFAYSAATSLDQRGGIDATAERGLHCLAGSEIGSLRTNKKAFISLYSAPELYYAGVCVNGTGLNMIVTHNVSHVVLTWNQAVDLNLKPNRMTFDQEVVIGAKTKRAASVVLKTVKIGDIVLENVDALVARDYELSAGVIGRTFLSRMKKTGVDNERHMVLIAK